VVKKKGVWVHTGRSGPRYFSVKAVMARKSHAHVSCANRCWNCNQRSLQTYLISHQGRGNRQVVQRSHCWDFAVPAFFFVSIKHHRNRCAGSKSWSQAMHWCEHVWLSQVILGSTLASLCVACPFGVCSSSLCPHRSRIRDVRRSAAP